MPNFDPARKYGGKNDPKTISNSTESTTLPRTLYSPPPVPPCVPPALQLLHYPQKPEDLSLVLLKPFYLKS